MSKQDCVGWVPSSDSQQRSDRRRDGPRNREQEYGKATPELNRSIESAARFLNLHARNGIPAKNLELAVVLHGSGARAALTPEAHMKYFELPNGSQGLVEALGEAGVAIYICGQTAAYYGYGTDELLPQITLAVSAMSVHVRLQQEGYQAILF